MGKDKDKDKDKGKGKGKGKDMIESKDRLKFLKLVSHRESMASFLS